MGVDLAMGALISWRAMHYSHSFSGGKDIFGKGVDCCSTSRIEDTRLCLMYV